MPVGCWCFFFFDFRAFPTIVCDLTLSLSYSGFLSSPSSHIFSSLALHTPLVGTSDKGDQAYLPAEDDRRRLSFGTSLARDSSSPADLGRVRVSVHLHGAAAPAAGAPPLSPPLSTLSSPRRRRSLSLLADSEMARDSTASASASAVDGSNGTVMREKQKLASASASASASAHPPASPRSALFRLERSHSGGVLGDRGSESDERARESRSASFSASARPDRPAATPPPLPTKPLYPPLLNGLYSHAAGTASVKTVDVRLRPPMMERDTDSVVEDTKHSSVSPLSHYCGESAYVSVLSSSSSRTAIAQTTPDASSFTQPPRTDRSDDSSERARESSETKKEADTPSRVKRQHQPPPASSMYVFPSPTLDTRNRAVIEEIKRVQSSSRVAASGGGLGCVAEDRVPLSSPLRVWSPTPLAPSFRQAIMADLSGGVYDSEDEECEPVEARPSWVSVGAGRQLRMSRAAAGGSVDYTEASDQEQSSNEDSDDDYR